MISNDFGGIRCPKPQKTGALRAPGEDFGHGNILSFINELCGLPRKVLLGPRESKEIV